MRILVHLVHIGGFFVLFCFVNLISKLKDYIRIHFKGLKNKKSAK